MVRTPKCWWIVAQDCHSGKSWDTGEIAKIAGIAKIAKI